METTPERVRGGLSGFTWALILVVVIGALNWGLVGVFGFDLVAAIFGEFTWLTRLTYVLVSLAGIALLAQAVNLSRPPRLA